MHSKGDWFRQTKEKLQIIQRQTHPSERLRCFSEWSTNLQNAARGSRKRVLPTKDVPRTSQTSRFHKWRTWKITQYCCICYTLPSRKWTKLQCHCW